MPYSATFFRQSLVERRLIEDASEGASESPKNTPLPLSSVKSKPIEISLAFGCLLRVFPDGCMSLLLFLVAAMSEFSLDLFLLLVFQWVFYALRATVARILICLFGLF